jgi:hypothetical protein
MPSPSRHAAAAAKTRWQRWQTSPLSRLYLTEAGAAAGYTVLHVPERLRGVFFDELLNVLQSRQLYESRQASVIRDTDDSTHPHAQLQAAWTAWRQWTRRLAAAHRRLAGGTQGTMPVLPAALQALGESDA